MFYQQEKYDQQVQNHHQLIDLRKEKVMNELLIDKQRIMNHRGNDFQISILTCNLKNSFFFEIKMFFFPVIELEWKSMIVFIIPSLVDLLLIQYPEIINNHLIQF